MRISAALLLTFVASGARAALPPDLASFGSLDAFPVAIPRGVPMAHVRAFSADTASVDLPPLLERHLSTTDSFMAAGGRTLIGGTLDFAGDGWLAVTPASAGTSSFIRIERGMSGSWRDGGKTYKVGLSVNIFRPRLENWIQIKDASTDRVVWERRISGLFKLTYAAGEPVTVAGRPYRLFYARVPDAGKRPAVPSASLGLCFIYDDMSSGTHEYKFYMVPVNQITGASPTSYKFYGGDAVRLQADPGLSVLRLSR